MLACIQFLWLLFLLTLSLQGAAQIASLEPQQPGTTLEVLNPLFENTPSALASISYHEGQLTVQARNSSLSYILRAIARKTGTRIGIPVGGEERVSGTFGPALPRAVIASLLNGSRFNYVLVGSAADPGRLLEVMLSLRSGTRASFTVKQSATNVEQIPQSPLLQTVPQSDVPQPQVRRKMDLQGLAGQTSATPDMNLLRGLQAIHEAVAQPSWPNATNLNASNSAAGNLGRLSKRRHHRP